MSNRDLAYHCDEVCRLWSQESGLYLIIVTAQLCEVSQIFYFFQLQFL
jgi:hypothetical protein